MANAELIGATMTHQADERRRRERFRLPAGTLAETDSGEPIAIVNISEHGFRAICTRPSDLGDSVSLMIGANGPLAAHVVWTDDNMIGCEFVTPLKRSVLAAIIESPPETI